MGNTCNCDANLPIPSTDTGTITNMTALPVKKLFFGGLSYELESAAYQLGRLKCYGDKDVDVATSCAALKKKGVMTSGYYNIKAEGDERPKLVFCDMKSGTYTDVPQVDEVSSASPLGTISAWVPHPEASQTAETLPEGWLPCNGSTITKGPWTGGKTPDLNSIGAFLRGGADDKVLEMEDDQVQDHEHDDLGHQHECSASSSAGSHNHKFQGTHLDYHDAVSDGESITCASSQNECDQEVYDEGMSKYTEDASVSVNTVCTTNSQSSGIGGVNSGAR